MALISESGYELETFLSNEPIKEGLSTEAINLDTQSIKDKLIPLIEELSSDANDGVRLEVVDVLNPVGRALYDNENKSSSEISVLIECGIKLLGDISCNVREGALHALLGLSQYINKENQMILFPPAIDKLIMRDSHFDRQCGLLLMATLCENNINIGEGDRILKWIELCISDENFEIRRDLARFYPMIMNRLNQVMLNIGITCFKCLIKDSIWSVRKAAAEVLPSLFEKITILNNEEREIDESINLQTVLLEYYNTLLQDQSKWVKMTALLNLGRIIVELNSNLITDELVEQFCCIMQERDASTDTLLLYNCAKTFPGVLKRIGHEKWPRLRHLYFDIVKTVNENIIYTLACSIHELASILPTSSFKQDVLPFLTKMMDMPSISIRAGLVKYMSELMKNVDEEVQKLVLSNLEMLTQCEISSVITSTSSITQRHQTFTINNTKNWRLKNIIAQNISLISDYISAELIMKYLLPYAFTMCEDSVAINRTVTSDQLALIWLKAETENNNHRTDSWHQIKMLIISQIIYFAQQNRFQTRCIACWICLKAVEKGVNIFKDSDDLKNTLQQLRNDPIIDVRRICSLIQLTV